MCVCVCVTAKSRFSSSLVLIFAVIIHSKTVLAIPVEKLAEAGMLLICTNRGAQVFGAHSTASANQAEMKTIRSEDFE